ncbi:MAG: EipB family protein [Alphaproteobacteria bacterium]
MAVTASPVAAKLVSHKAFYSLKLGQLRPGSNFSGVSGNMALELKKTCDGWTMSQTLVMDLGLPDGRQIRQDLRFTGWESPDGTEYRFFASNRTGDEREDFRGYARLGDVGGAGNAHYRVPEANKIPLPENTLFPLGHTMWLIERATAGDRLANTIVFDGADGEGPQRVSAFIGPKLAAGAHQASAMVKKLGPLLDRPGWKIRMAFYPLDSQTSVPDYEVEVLQLDNGIVPTMLLDYQEFTVLLEPEQLEMIAPPKCD